MSIAVDQVSKRYGAQTVLSNVSLRLGSGQKAALVGHNGVGKSTLLRIIAAVEEPDAGEVSVPPNLLLGYLGQEVAYEGDETIEEYLRRTTGVDALERKLAELEGDLTSAANIEEYSDLQTRFANLGGYEFDHRIQVVLTGFGLTDIDSKRLLRALSGGQRSKVALGGILLRGLDVLLLDEPTNNLDLPALLWLENFLIQSPATILMVSHDRRFLDRVVSRVYELDWRTRGITPYRGGYTDFLKYKRQELERQKVQYEAEQEEIERLNDTVRQKKQWAAMGARQMMTDNDKFFKGAHRDWSAGIAQRGKGIEKRLEQMDKIERPVERDALAIPLKPADNPAKQVIDLKNVMIGYKDGFVLGPVNLTLKNGMRVAIIGPNGSGKTTLLKVITGDLPPLSGSVLIGSSLVIGNMMQAHENLPRNVSPVMFLDEEAGLAETDAYSILRAFQFDLLDISKQIDLLSPGARTRLLLAYFSAIQANVLVLDEPTNHLDLEAVEALEDVLRTYDGVVVMVSHDRYFLERARPTQTFLLKQERIAEVASFDAFVAETDTRAKNLLARL